MQIYKKSQDSFLIKSKEGNIQLGNDGVEIDGLLFSGPGEYERKGIFVEGFAPDGYGTVFIIHSEDINICYAAKVNTVLSGDAVKMLGDVDILIISLGQETGMSTKDAEKNIAKIDPRIIVPAVVEESIDIETTLGLSAEIVDSLKIKRADLPEEDRKLFCIK